MNSVCAKKLDLWLEFRHASKIDDDSSLTVSASIPGNKAIADKLVSLYLSGNKVAGSGLVRDYELGGDPMPTVGSYWIILDSAERARCIARTIRVEINRFEEVSEEIARSEGEGDLSIEYWRKAHRNFFTPYLSKLGIECLDNALVVTEFYEIVYSK